MTYIAKIDSKYFDTRSGTFLNASESDAESDAGPRQHQIPAGAGGRAGQQERGPLLQPGTRQHQKGIALRKVPLRVSTYLLSIFQYITQQTPKILFHMLPILTRCFYFCR